MNSRGLKLVFIFLIVVFVIVGCGFYKFTCNTNAQRLYKQGMDLYSKGKYSDAYHNFRQIKKFADLYELSILKQYQCANKLSDKKTAHIKLLELIKKTKDVNIRPFALYNEAIMSEAEKRNDKNQLYKKFKYIYETYPNSDFAVASAYKMAKNIEDTDKNLALKKYIEYLSYAPNGKFALNSLEGIKSDTQKDKEEWEIIGQAYLSNGKYNDALKAYQNTLFSKNWHKIAKCYQGLKNTEQEKNTIIKGLELTASEIDEKDISSAIDRLINITGANKIQTLQNLYTKYPNSYILPTVAYKLAESSGSIRAIKLYEMVSEKHPTSIWASNSLWEVFWYNYQQSRFKTCEKLAKKHIEFYPNTQDAPRISYWYGRVLLKEHKKQEARDVFYNTINNFPLSYYSFLSAKQLKSSKAKKMIVKKPIDSYDISLLNKHIFKDKTLSILAEKNDYEAIDELKINDEYIQSWVAYQQSNYTKSINLAKKKLLDNKEQEISDKDEEQEQIKIKFNNFALKMIYPIHYEKEINALAQDFKQSPYLFLSLVREESHFDKNARSSAGAMGLSQLMQPTADFIERKKVSKETLFNAEENLRIGLKYFSYLVNYFEGDEYLSILSYNAGPGNINKWMNNPSIKSDEIEVFVENIPYLETKNYIKKILSSYWIYLNIYSSKNR